MEADTLKNDVNSHFSSDQQRSSWSELPTRKKMSIGDFNKFSINPSKPLVVKPHIPHANQFTPKPIQEIEKFHFLTGKRILLPDSPNDGNNEKKRKITQHNLSASLLESEVLAKESSERKEPTVQSPNSRSRSVCSDEIRASLSSSLNMIPPHRKRSKRQRSKSGKVDSIKRLKIRSSESSDDGNANVQIPGILKKAPSKDVENVNNENSRFCLNCAGSPPQKVPSRELPVIKIKKDPITKREITPSRAFDILKSAVMKMIYSGIDVPVRNKDAEVRTQEISLPSFGPEKVEEVPKPSTSIATPSTAVGISFPQLPVNNMMPTSVPCSLPVTSNINSVTSPSVSNPLPISFGLPVSNAQVTPPSSKPVNLNFNTPVSNSLTLTSGPSTTTSVPTSSIPVQFTFGSNNQTSTSLTTPALVSTPSTTASAPSTNILATSTAPTTLPPSMTNNPTVPTQSPINPFPTPVTTSNQPASTLFSNNNLGSELKFGSNPAVTTSTATSITATPAPGSTPFPSSFMSPSNNLNFTSSSNNLSSPKPLFGMSTSFSEQKSPNNTNASNNVQPPSTAPAPQDSKPIFAVPSTSAPVSNGQQLPFGNPPSNTPFPSTNQISSPFSQNVGLNLQPNPLQFSTEPPKTVVITNAAAPPSFSANIDTPKPGGFSFNLNTNPSPFGSNLNQPQPPAFTAPAVPSTSNGATNLFANNNPQPSTSAAVPNFGSPSMFGSQPVASPSPPVFSNVQKPAGLVFGSNPTTSPTPKPSFQFSSAGTNKQNFVFGAPSTSQQGTFQFTQQPSVPTFSAPGPSTSTFQFSATPQTSQISGMGFSIGTGGSTSSRNSRDYRKRR